VFHFVLVECRQESAEAQASGRQGRDTRWGVLKFQGVICGAGRCRVMFLYKNK